MSLILPVLNSLFTLYDGLSTDLAVFRGKYVTVPDGDFLTVGWAANTPAAVSGEQSFVTAENVVPRGDGFTVVNYVETLGGDTDDASILARQSRLFGYWDQIQQVHTDQHLAGAIPQNQGYAEITRYDFTPDESTSGYVAGLVFYIDVHAYF